MVLISHRGNLSGIDKSIENQPDHIEKILSLQINCEVDVWRIDGEYYLGHDNPQYKISQKFLLQNNLWCHAKNLDALNCMLDLGVHCFWHENDDFTITSFGYIWTFPEKNVVNKSIIVDNNKNWRLKNYKCFGVCSDYIII